MSERGTSGFGNTGGGNRASADSFALLRRIQQLERFAQSDRADGLVVPSVDLGGGLYVCHRLEGRSTLGNTAQLYYGLPISSGTHFLQNVHQNGTFGTQVPLGLPVLASRRPRADGGDDFICPYGLTSSTNGVGGGAGGGGSGDGGGAGGGGGGGGTGSPSDTLKVLWLSTYSCEDPVGWSEPTGVWASDCGPNNGLLSDGVTATNTWLPNGDDFNMQYWQETAMDCFISDLPPAPAGPITTPTCP